VKYTEEADQVSPLDYIVKPWNEEQIKVALRRAFNYIDSKKENMNLMGELSPAEYRILSLIAEQKTSKEIGEQLFISEKTVRNHRYNISKKLNLENTNNNLLKWAIANFSK
jgi:DNA-binding CsgD family transcriptional regulator